MSAPESYDWYIGKIRLSNGNLCRTREEAIIRIAELTKQFMK
jgi:hypothetical protein